MLRRYVPMWRHPLELIDPVSEPDEAIKRRIRTQWKFLFWLNAALAAGFWFVGLFFHRAWVLDVCFQTFLSVGVFIATMQLSPPLLKKIVPPAFSCSGVIACLVIVQAISKDGTWQDGLGSYKTGNWSHFGGGDLIGLLLGPSVINLAFNLLASQDRVAKCKWKIIIGVTVNFLISSYATAAAAGALSISSSDWSLCLLSRMITAPIAVGIAKLLYAPPGLAAAFSVISGTFGAIFGRQLLTLFGVRNKVARGVAMGSSAHGLGTAALVTNAEPEAGAVAAASFAFMGTLAAVLLTVPFVLDSLVRLLQLEPT
eukprot:gb/GEZN01012947.1/.p1 GENE.gb/GEZN01012947.1/~~gb/GEZN01012947.1/.p1  ORF type:complete len:340 (+),score=36.87 gb/GEZN01012947.1/:82-1020(+)